MEPFRILVDRMVVKLVLHQFEKEEKHQLLAVLNRRVVIDNREQNVLNAIKIYTYSVFEAINDRDPFKIKFYKLGD